MVDIVAGRPGPTSDIELWRERRERFVKGQSFLGDKGYVGADQITTPSKKPKGRELEPEKIAENREISQVRIFIEHLIGRFKIFRIASERFRLAAQSYPQVMQTISGLVRINLGTCPIFSSPNDKATKTETI